MPCTPSIYPAGAPAGVYGGLPGSEILAQILALNSSCLPGSNVPTCYPASSRAVCKRKTLLYTPSTYPAGAPAGVHGGLLGSKPLPTPDWLPGSDLPTAKRNALNHARELTRLTHPAPDSMSRGSLFSGLPISGCQAAAAYSAGGPVGPTLQASTWVGEQVQYAFA